MLMMTSPSFNASLSSSSSSPNVHHPTASNTNIKGKKPYKSWLKDGVNGGPCSMDVLVNWLSKKANYAKWKGDDCERIPKKSLLEDIIEEMRQVGIYHRLAKDVASKISTLQSNYRLAREWKEVDGSKLLKQGTSEESVHEELLKRFPYWDALDEVFSNNNSNNSTTTTKPTVTTLENTIRNHDHQDYNRSIHIHSSNTFHSVTTNIKQSPPASWSMSISNLMHSSHSHQQEPRANVSPLAEKESFEEINYAYPFGKRKRTSIDADMNVKRSLIGGIHSNHNATDIPNKNLPTLPPPISSSQLPLQQQQQQQQHAPMIIRPLPRVLHAPMPRTPQSSNINNNNANISTSPLSTTSSTCTSPPPLSYPNSSSSVPTNRTLSTTTTTTSCYTSPPPPLQLPLRSLSANAKTSSPPLSQRQAHQQQTMPTSKTTSLIPDITKHINTLPDQEQRLILAESLLQVTREKEAAKMKRSQEMLQFLREKRTERDQLLIEKEVTKRVKAKAELVKNLLDAGFDKQAIAEQLNKL